MSSSWPPHRKPPPPPIPQRCPRTGERPFRTRRAAEAHLALLGAHGAGSSLEPVACETCRGWDLERKAAA